MSAIKSVDESNFAGEVLGADGPVLVDFWAPWCGPCLRQAPILEELAQGRDDLNVVKVDVDANQELAIRYGVQSIPTLILFHGGEPLLARSGLHSLSDLEDMVRQGFQTH
jgi:thioredoxin 1